MFSYIYCSFELTLGDSALYFTNTKTKHLGLNENTKFRETKTTGDE